MKKGKSMKNKSLKYCFIMGSIWIFCSIFCFLCIYVEWDPDIYKTENKIRYKVVPDTYVKDGLIWEGEYTPEFRGLDYIDTLTATSDELKNSSLCREKIIDNEFIVEPPGTPESAAMEAYEIIKELYPPEPDHNCAEQEQPFYVCYNKNANAWIISGTTSINVHRQGGAVCIAIEKDTGRVIMAYHTL